jgi:hypothetical protein
MHIDAAAKATDTIIYCEAPQYVIVSICGLFHLYLSKYSQHSFFIHPQSVDDSSLSHQFNDDTISASL